MVVESVVYAIIAYDNGKAIEHMRRFRIAAS